jgi:FkbM family methyltransferase
MAQITSRMLRARLTEQLAMSALPPLTDTQPDYSRLDLQSIPDDEGFVIEAYRRIVERQPDLDGMHHFLQVLKTHPRQTVIDALTNARQSAPATAQRTPQSASGFVDLTDMDRFGAADELVKEGYRRILGREGDGAGLAHYRDLLACGVPRAQVLAIIAASAEARSRNLRFLWHGTSLPAPGRLGLATRLRLLAWRLTGRSRLEDALVSLSVDMRAMGVRYESLREDVQVLSTKVLNTQTSIEEKYPTISAMDAMLGVVYQKLDATLGGVFQKLDAIAGDVRIREEAIRARVEAIAGMIRPPVLAGTDVLVTKVDDFVLAIPREDWSLAAYYSYWGTVDQGLTRCFTALLRPGMVVADIGANIGLHTLQAARGVGELGKVYSFEPAPRTLDILRKNVKASGFQCVELFPFAVLDRHGQVRLHLYEGESPLNTLFAESGQEQSIPVEAVMLDEVLRGREHVDIVKIDAEGAEPFILRGMKRILAANPALIVLLEFAPTHLQRAGVAPADFLHELRATEFEIRRVDDLTGELSTPADEQLLTANSSNLHLQRPGRI